MPIGIVAEEETVRANEVYLEHRVTEPGKKYGIPLAIFSLEWAVDNGISLYSTLGSTHSRVGNGAPFNRLKILKVLNERGELRNTDLVDILKISGSNVRLNLRALQKLGFVSYDSVPEMHEAKGTFQYRFTGKEGIPETIRGCTRLTLDVLDIIKESEEEEDCHSISRQLACDLSSCSGILIGLERQGFLERAGKFKGNARSSASIEDNEENLSTHFIQYGREH